VSRFAAVFDLGVAFRKRLSIPPSLAEIAAAEQPGHHRAEASLESVGCLQIRCPRRGGYARIFPLGGKGDLSLAG